MTLCAHGLTDRMPSGGCRPCQKVRHKRYYLRDKIGRIHTAQEKRKEPKRRIFNAKDEKALKPRSLHRRLNDFFKTKEKFQTGQDHIRRQITEHYLSRKGLKK